VVLSGVLVLAVAGGGAWWWTRGGTLDEPAAPSGDADAQLVRDKWDARRGTGDEEAPCSARGRVARASDGTGVANASVTLMRPQIISSPEPVVTITDASGEWSVEGLAPGRYDIAVTSAGERPALLRGVVLSAGKDHPNIDHALEAGGTVVSGTITDPNGAPIAGARFEAIRAIDQSGGLPSMFATVADDHGRYALRLDPEHYMVGVVHRDHVRIRSRMLLTDTPRTRDYRLVPGGVIRGRVLARADGRPIAGAILRVQPPVSAKFGSDTAGYETRAVSDETGAFEMRGLPSGAVTIAATAPGWTNVELTTVPLGVAEEVEGVEVLADPAYRLAGFVVAADDETVGVRDVSLVAFDLTNPGRMRLSEPSQADGYFVVHGIAPGRYWLVAWGNDIVASFDQTLEVEDHDVDDHLVRAERGHALLGRVEPAADVMVYASISTDFGGAGLFALRSMMKTMMSTFRAVRPAPDGTFALRPLAAGKYIIEARGRSELRGTIDVEIADADKDGVTIPLAAGVRLSGSVQDATGEPVSGVTVNLMPEVQRTITMSSMFSGTGLEAVTDESGRFDIGGIEPGKYKYQVRDDLMLGMPWAEPEDPQRPAHERVVELSADRSIDLSIASARTLAGRVLDEHGKPVAGAWIVAWPELALDELSFGFDGGTGMAKGKQPALPESLTREMSRQLSPMFALPAVLSDDDGRFVVEGMRRSRYTITAHAARGQLTGRDEGVEPASAFELELAPVGALHVKLAGAPANGSITVRLEGPEARRVEFRDSRELVIERLAPADWRVVVEAPGGTAAAEAEIIAGSTTDLDLTLAAWSSITGTIVDRTTGEPVGGLQPMIERKLVTADEVVGRSMQWLTLMQGGSKDRVDAQGRFTIEHLTPGSITVEFIELPGLQVSAELRLADLRAAETRDVGSIPALVLPEVPAGEHGWLGITARAPGPPGQPSPLVVTEIEDGSPAALADLRVDDEVVRIDDIEVAEIGSSVARRLLANKHVRVGDARILAVRRAGHEHTVSLRAVQPKPKPKP
jgi:protocatechuate 3,4-dioxygenase beta subunit